MWLICPGCGLTASAEAWSSDDAACRDLLAAMVKLPHPLPSVTLQYLSLFRPEQKVLTWKKALRLVKVLATLVASGYVEVDRKAPRPCPPSIWCQAMEQMLERRQSLKLPMEGHVYLRKVAYDLADAADAQGERKRNEAERAGNLPRERIASTNPLAKLMGEQDA